LGRDAILAKQSGEGDLDVISRPLQVEQGFLGGGGEGLGLLNLELELAHVGSLPDID
jgi:hypothetical protein